MTDQSGDGPDECGHPRWRCVGDAAHVVEAEGDDAVGDVLVDRRQFDLDGRGVGDLAVMDGRFEDRHESPIDPVDGLGASAF